MPTLQATQNGWFPGISRRRGHCHFSSWRKSLAYPDHLLNLWGLQDMWCRISMSWFWPSPDWGFIIFSTRSDWAMWGRMEKVEKRIWRQTTGVRTCPAKFNEIHYELYKHKCCIKSTIHIPKKYPVYSVQYSMLNFPIHLYHQQISKSSIRIKSGILTSVDSYGPI